MTEESIKSILKKLPLFQGVNNLDFEDIVNLLDFELVTLRKKEVIIHQNTACNHLHILLEGQLEVNIIDSFGNKIKIEVLKSPRPFAIPHIFSNNDIFPATFTVLEDGILLRAPKEKVFELISKYPVLLKNFLKERGNCNSCTVARLKILSYKTIRSRFSYYLEQHKIDERISLLEHNQTQLADYIGVSRPAMANEIKKMIKEGIISIDGNSINLLNINELHSYI